MGCLSHFRTALLGSIALLSLTGETVGQTDGVHFESVNKATLDYYEKLIAAGDWNNVFIYFDSRPTPPIPTSENDASGWERYLFTAADAHLRRSGSDGLSPDAKYAQAKKAEEACRQYIEWYGRLSDDQLAWLPFVKAKAGQNDPPFTRGRIRHILGLLIQAILTQDNPDRVSAALADIDGLWFGTDAIKNWIDALGYVFSTEGTQPNTDLGRIRRNLTRAEWPDAVRTFVAKLDEIEARRKQINGQSLNKTWLALRDKLRTEAPEDN